MAIKPIDTATLKKWMDNHEAVILDVREPAEYTAECIPGSTLLPLASVQKSALPDYRGKKLVIHCRSGKRGTSACEKLLAEDSNLDIYHLEGGILAWKQSGLMVTSSGKFFLPLDRQVQLTIGTGVLLGVLLGYSIHPGFYLLSAFFGAGLVFAALSGTCMLAQVIAKMPWNQ
ncbi:MAG: rhodanese protein [uncultured bacterium]|nr:MAG: rhodanese protein [uncultured bacterium]